MFNRLLTVFWVVFFQRPCSSEQFFFKNFQGCITVYLSRYIFFVLALHRRNSCYLIRCRFQCQALFSTFFISVFFVLSASDPPDPGRCSCPLPFSAATLVILSSQFTFVNTLFCSFINTFGGTLLPWLSNLFSYCLAGYPVNLRPRQFFPAFPLENCRKTAQSIHSHQFQFKPEFHTIFIV